MWLLSLFFLGVTALVCVAGIFAENFDDNLGQRVGMSIIAIACVDRIYTIMDSHHVSFTAFLLYAGMAVFAVSTAFKIYEHAVRKVRYDMRSQK